MMKSPIPPLLSRRLNKDGTYNIAKQANLIFVTKTDYRQKAAAANSEISEEISAKLLELERKKGRIEYYVGMLDSRKANVIRLCFFDGRTIEDAAEELNISAKTAQIAKKKAIEDLTDLFALTSNIN